jgi:hypothetical protein
MKFLTLVSLATLLALACSAAPTPESHPLNRAQQLATGVFDSSRAQEKHKENSLVHPISSIKAGFKGLKAFARHPIKAIGNWVNVVKGQFKKDAWRTTGRVARDAAVAAGTVIGAKRLFSGRNRV